MYIKRKVNIVDLNINLNLPEPVNKSLNPIATAAGETFSNIWSACFSTINLWAKKRIIKHEQDFLEFKQSVETHYTNIPDEYKSEPNLSIIGPALEASKFYIQEKSIREMFAKLITADMDTRKKNNLHHSFVEIIKQLSPHDALLLSKLPKVGPIGEIRLYNKDESTYSLRTKEDLIIIPDIPELINIDTSIAINNLNRLGLAQINHIMSLVNKSCYAPYEDLPEFKDGLLLVKTHPELFTKVEVNKGMYSITPFGDAFKSICI
ncbi:DUF4393 domain-containing protein [Veillonella atypica]|jgi:hypothetical protein|uniref:DUF4393 domain-containing protein n=1 Tax=Veillonella atypica TaxID=39777 RepID=A0A3A6WE28_9FIRM|nr:DUF4393 domain-containing protein [Veillonella atypica]